MSFAFSEAIPSVASHEGLPLEAVAFLLYGNGLENLLGGGWVRLLDSYDPDRAMEVTNER